MSYAYLILAHKNPRQLRRLVDALKCEDDTFVIHLDAGSDISDFKCLFAKDTNVIFLKKRWETKWGSFELVQATLSGLEYINLLPSVSRVTLLSGQDYPIKSVPYIKEFLGKRPDCIFMECFKIPWKHWNSGGVRRFPKYEIAKDVIEFYGGSQWFSIPHNLISIIFQFLALNPLYVEYYKSVIIADESFFQTLIMNSGVNEIIEQVTYLNLHLIQWNKHLRHPRVFNSSDLNLILESNQLFARKFDDSTSVELLNYIDAHVL